MSYLRTKGFYKYYNAILNNTLVKAKTDELSFVNENQIFDADENDTRITSNDILIGIVQTNPPKTEKECTFPLFDFYGQPCAMIFYRAYDNCDNLIDNIYVYNNKEISHAQTFIKNNPFGLNLDGFAYPNFLNDIILKYESDDNTPQEKQVIKIIKQTAMYLAAQSACKSSLNDITSLQQVKYLTGKLKIKQIVEKKENEAFVKKVYFDTKTLSPTKFVEKYDQTMQKTEQNEQIK